MSRLKLSAILTGKFVVILQHVSDAQVFTKEFGEGFEVAIVLLILFEQGKPDEQHLAQSRGDGLPGQMSVLCKLTDQVVLHRKVNTGRVRIVSTLQPWPDFNSPSVMTPVCKKE